MLLRRVFGCVVSCVLGRVAEGWVLAQAYPVLVKGLCFLCRAIVRGCLLPESDQSAF